MSIPAKIRRALHERADSRCEICGEPANNAHHRRNKSQGGQDRLANLMLLCGSGTTGCHGEVTLNPEWAKLKGYTIHGRVDGEAPETVPVLIRGGRCLLEDDGTVVLIPGEVAS
ncbi:HNH endonuclease [Mycolicibacterium sp. XJ775]